MLHEKRRKTGETSDLSVNLSNALAEAAHRLTLTEKRIIAQAIAQIDSRRPALSMPPLMRVTAGDYAKLYGIDLNNVYAELKRGIENLYERSIGFKVYKRKGHVTEPAVQSVRWVTSKTYHDGEAWVELRFSPEVMPHLTLLHGAFVSYKLAQASALRSVFSWRLLELLTQFEKTGWRQDGIEDFHHAMDAKESQRKNFGELRRTVIEPAIKELVEKDGWLIKWKPIKAGRKVIAVRFDFQRNPQHALL